MSPDTRKTILNVLKYFAFNGLFAVCLYFGLFDNADDKNEGAYYIAMFMAWVTGVAGALMYLGFLGDEKKMNLLAAKMPKSSIPFWFDCMFDICVLLAVVYTGHWVLGIFYFIQIHNVKMLRDAQKNVTLAMLRGDYDERK